MTITEPYDYRPGSLPLLVSIPHAGTRLTPAVEDGLSDAARPLPDTDWHIPLLYDFARQIGRAHRSGHLFAYGHRSEPPAR